MKKLALQVAILIAGGSLAACSSFDSWWGDNNAGVASRPVSQNQGNQASTEPVSNPAAQKAVGGHAARGMDSIDRSKLWHALDKPIGKTTSWTNASSNMSYTVVSTEKVTINGNNFCRRYQVTATPIGGGNSRVTGGTACVGSDGNWEAVGN